MFDKLVEGDIIEEIKEITKNKIDLFDYLKILKFQLFIPKCHPLR